MLLAESILCNQHRLPEVDQLYVNTGNLKQYHAFDRLQYLYPE